MTIRYPLMNKKIPMEEDYYTQDGAVAVVQEGVAVGIAEEVIGAEVAAGIGDVEEVDGRRKDGVKNGEANGINGAADGITNGAMDGEKEEANGTKTMMAITGATNGTINGIINGVTIMATMEHGVMVMMIMTLTIVNAQTRLIMCAVQAINNMTTHALPDVP